VGDSIPLGAAVGITAALDTATGLHHSTASKVDTPAPPPPPRQVNFPSSSFYFCHLRFLLHAEHSFCMQEEGGEIIPPVSFLCWARLVLAQLVLLMGQADPSPSLPSGPGLAQKRILFFGPRSAQSILGRNRPNTFGLSPAQSVGPDQPSPFNIILYIYIYYILYYLYICIYMKNYKTIMQKL